jgi:hypothetical protein
MGNLKISRNPLIQVAAESADREFTSKLSSSQLELKVARRDNAKDSVSDLKKGFSRFIITKGQFSMVDWIRVILEQIGPSEVFISTWTAAIKDLEEIQTLVLDGYITSIKWLVDFTMFRRQSDILGMIRTLFGDENVRISKNHSKFVTFSNENWHIVGLTSMNLNFNPRMENIAIHESKELHDFMLTWIIEIFNKNKPVNEIAEKSPQWHKNKFKTV